MKYLFIFLVVNFFSRESLFSQQWRLAKGTEGFAAADIDIYYNDPDTMYAIGSFINNHSAPGLLISTDRGESWNVAKGQSTDVGAVKVDPFDSKRIYVSVYGRDDESNDLKMTTDGGTTWNERNNGLDSTNWDISSLLVNPKEAFSMFLGTYTTKGTDDTVGVFRTTTGGNAWIPFDYGSPRRSLQTCF